MKLGRRFVCVLPTLRLHWDTRDKEMVTRECKLCAAWVKRQRRRERTWRAREARRRV